MSIPTTNDKRELILTAAEKLLAEEGIHSLSMHNLAKQAGVATGTIYRYFTDKDELLKQVRLSVTQRIADTIQANVDQDMPLKQRFRTMWLNIWRLAENDLDTLKNRAQFDTLPNKNITMTLNTERTMFYHVERLFNEGKQTGLFKPLDNQILGGLSFHVSVALARKRSLGFYQLNDADIDAVIDASWDAIIQH